MNKKNENDEGFVSVLDSVSGELSSLDYAEQLQKKAAHYAFDWPTIAPVFDKIQEEIEELKEALAHPNSEAPAQQQHIIEEMGDVLFCCVNLARVINVNSDTALSFTNQKFINRFKFIEQAVQKQGKVLGKVTLDELDQLWKDAKTAKG